MDMTAVTPEGTLPATMPRPVRFILRTLIVLGTLFLVFLLVSAYLYNSTPAMYMPPRLSPQESAAAAEAAENKLISVRNWAEHTRSINSARLHGRVVPSIGPITVTATDAQINAFFQKWKSLIQWDQKYAQYVSNPSVAIVGGRIVLVGEVRSLHTVLSLIFNAKINDDGQLQVTLEQVRAGRLAVPELIWDSQKGRIIAAITQHLPAWERRARMGPAGSTNPAGVALAMSRALLSVFAGQPVTPVVFVPVDSSSAMPAHISAIHIGDGKLTLTLHAMSTEQRQAYWQKQIGSEQALAARR